MLRRVYVRNYKSIAEAEVTLERFTVFIGPNGSGKSNFVDALRFMRDAIVSGLDTAISHRRGIRAIRRWSPRRPVDVAIALELIFPDGTQTIYGFELGSEKGGEYRECWSHYLPHQNRNPLGLCSSHFLERLLPNKRGIFFALSGSIIPCPTLSGNQHTSQRLSLHRFLSMARTCRLF